MSLSRAESIIDPGGRYCLAAYKVNLPISREANSQNATKNKFIKGKILIVEDERLICESLKEQLEENGHTVMGIADSADEAIDFVHKTAADLMIVDIRLRGAIDGIQTALILHKTIKKLPIIFLTAHSADQFPHLALIDPSLYLYLTKPFLDADLMAAVQTLLSKTDASD
jgi:DNA-binding response OmpR family regulator